MASHKKRKADEMSADPGEDPAPTNTTDYVWVRRPRKYKAERKTERFSKLIRKYLTGHPTLVIRILKEVIREENVARVLRYRKERRSRPYQDLLLSRVHYWRYVSPFKCLFLRNEKLDMMAKKVFFSINIIETHTKLANVDLPYDIDLNMTALPSAFLCIKHLAFAAFDPVTHVHGAEGIHGNILRDVDLIKHCPALKRITLLDFASAVDASPIPPNGDWTLEKIKYRNYLRKMTDHPRLEKIELRISTTIKLTEELRKLGLTAEKVVENRLKKARLFKECLREGFLKTGNREVRVDILQVRDAFSGMYK